MTDPIDFDPGALYLWPVGRAGPEVYGVDGIPGAAAAADAARSILLETKAAAEPSPAEQLQGLLNDMTTEMRKQFDVFRAIRIAAEARLSSDDEGELKLAKADIKSTTDALSLLVRSIEKIDSLQRSLAHDREIAATGGFTPEAYDALLASIRRRIEDRAAELAGQSGAEAAAERHAGPPDAEGASQPP